MVKKISANIIFLLLYATFNRKQFLQAIFLNYLTKKARLTKLQLW